MCVLNDDFGTFSLEFTCFVVCVGCKGNWGIAKSENEAGEDMQVAHVASATREALASKSIHIGGFSVENLTLLCAVFADLSH